MSLRKIYLLLLLWLPGVSLAQVQTFGLQTSMGVMQSNSPYLSDYADGTAGLQLFVNLRDASRQDYTFQLKFRLLLNGQMVMESKAGYSDGPHTVYGFTPLILTGPDMAGLFTPSNLILNLPGKNSNQDFLTTGNLPEGRYTLEIWAVAANRPDQQVSNRARVSITTMLSDPPQWQQPRQEEIVLASDPQNVAFSWSPSNGLGAASVVDTRYTFRIWELVDPGLDPNYVTLSTRPLEEITDLISSQLVYNQFNTPLIPGMRYAVQVQAMDINGRTLFRNEGRSEVRVFQYGRECTEANGFSYSSNRPSTVDLSWQPGEANSRFEISFREADNATAQWFTKSSNRSTVQLSDLKPNTLYEYQVFPYCGSLSAPPTKIKSFRTAATKSSPDPAVELECGNTTAPEAIANQEPLGSLLVGDVIYVGEFEVFITEVSGAGDTYSGKGSVAIPWLFARIGVTFEDARINTDNRVYEGRFVGIGEDMSRVPPEVTQRIAETVSDLEDPKFCVEDAEDEGGFFGTSDTTRTDTVSGDLEVLITNPADSVTEVLVNGETVSITYGDSLVLEEGDVVEVPGSGPGTGTYVMGSGGGTVKPSFDPSGTDASDTPNEIPTFLSENIPNLLEPILKELILPKVPQIDTHRTAVLALSGEISQLIKAESSDSYREGDLPLDFLGEGLSLRVTVRAWAGDPNRGNGSTLVYNKHRRAYVEDQQLQYKTRYTEAGFEYLIAEGGDYRLATAEESSLIQFQAAIERELGLRYSPTELDSLSKPRNMSSTRVILKDIVDYLLDESVATSYTQGMGWFSPDPAGQGLYAFAGQDFLLGSQYRLIGDYAIDNLLDNEPPVALTPAERIALLHYILQEDPYAHLAKSVDPGSETRLPIGLSQNFGGMEYLIALTDVVFTPQGASLNVYMALDVPGAMQKVAFSAEGLGFSPGGFSGGQDTKLSLLSDLPVRLSNDVRLWVRGSTGGTYVKFDCDGFTGFGLSGSFEFCDGLVVKEGPNGQPLEGEYVQARFSLDANGGWENFMTGADIDRFHPKDMEGWSFEIDEAFVDLSDLSNPGGIVFPAEYQTNNLIPPQPTLWRGVYMKRATVWLPPEFTKQDSLSRISISAQDILIDDNGFSGLVSADNLLPLDQGNAGGWAFSLDHVEVEFVTNTLTAGALAGQLVLPISEGTRLNYGAAVQLGTGGALPQYNFLVELDQVLDVPMFGVATMELAAGSAVMMDSKVVNGQNTLVPSANLNGRLLISAGTEGGSKAELPSLSFEKLCLNCDGKKLSIQRIAYGNPGEQGLFGDFPITIQEIGLSFPGDSIGLDLTVGLNLGKPEEGGFGGSASLAVWAKEDTQSERLRYEFSRVKLTGFGVYMSVDPVTIEGKFRWFENHPVYGKGFSGLVKGGVADFDGVELSVVFGNNGYRYWFADMMVALPPMTMLIPQTPIEVNGVGGGAYRHMRQAGAEDTNTGGIGKSLSGVVYVPDQETALGVKAALSFSMVGTPDIFSSDATFEMTFNKHGGLNMMQMRGNVEVLPPPIEVDLGAVASLAANVGGGGSAIPAGAGGAAASGSIKGSMVLTYDFQNEVFDGNSELFVNYFGLIKGAGPKGRAGWSDMYFTADDWHLFAGTPNDPWGLDILGIDATAYFMMGNGLPMPNPPPPQVSQELGINLEAERQSLLLEGGKGVAMGGSLRVNTGDLNFMMFYGNFAAGVGFDMMMLHYPGQYCADATQPVGVNGWFASGNAYAYVVGKVGVKVDLPVMKGNFDILDIGAAALFEAQMPNPVWLRGTVGGRYSILNGLVQGDCRFEVEYGTRCDLQGPETDGGRLSGIHMIASLTPGDGATEVDVFTAPQAVFNMPVDQPFTLKSKDGKSHTYRIKLVKFMLRDGGQTLNVVREWNEEHDVLALNPVELLPSEKELTMEVTIVFQKKVGSRWENVEDKGEYLMETKSITFTSGPRPDYIVESNVEYTYPLREMVNFYRDEYNRGYLQLDESQAYLFGHSSEWMQVAIFQPPTGRPLMTRVRYNRNLNRVVFPIPAGLPLNTVLALEIRDIPLTSPLLVDANVEDVQTEALEGDAGDGNTMTITTQEAQGTLDRQEEQILYSLHFRTSKYRSLAAKLNARQHVTWYSGYISQGTFFSRETFRWDEYFEERELNGMAAAGVQPLVAWEAALVEPHYTQDIGPAMYDAYPAEGLRITHRPVSRLGVPPGRAVYFSRAVTPYSRLVAEENYLFAQNYQLEYKVTLPYRDDYNDLRAKVINRAVNQQPLGPYGQRMLEQRGIPRIRDGYYTIYFHYYLPGATEPNSTVPVRTYFEF